MVKNPISTLRKELSAIFDVLDGQGVNNNDFLLQVTYLLFLKMDEDLSLIRGYFRIPEPYRWSTLLYRDQERCLKLSPLEQLEHYGEILKALSAEGSDYDEDGLVGCIFARAQNSINSGLYLAKLIDAIDKVNWLDFDCDTQSLMYEELLEHNCKAKMSGAGQYYTSRALIQAIVDVVQPQPSEVIWDPACGTGGFLVAAHEYVRKQQKGELFLLDSKAQVLFGQDNVPYVVALGTMNLFLHGLDVQSSPITLGDSLLKLPDTLADVVVTNPPFGSRFSGSRQIVRDDFILLSNDNQLNFLQHIMSLMKIGGRAAVVLPDNVLFSRIGAPVRKTLLQEFNLHTILRLPLGLFYSQGVKTNVLFFTKGEPTKEVWVYDFREGIDLSLRRNPLQRQDLEDFVSCYQPDGHGGYGERHETFDPEKNADGRWRRFPVSFFLQRDHCNLNPPKWIGVDKSGDKSSLDGALNCLEQQAQCILSTVANLRHIVEKH